MESTGKNVLELNWSTLLLEIINFLILVWILKHFFYKPVLAVIARRRSIEESLNDANTLHEDAEALIARAGNGVYDGPDNWGDRIANKMRIVGYVGDQGGTQPWRRQRLRSRIRTGRRRSS